MYVSDARRTELGVPIMLIITTMASLLEFPASPPGRVFTGLLDSALKELMRDLRGRRKAGSIIRRMRERARELIKAYPDATAPMNRFHVACSFFIKAGESSVYSGDGEDFPALVRCLDFVRRLVSEPEAHRSVLGQAIAEDHIDHIAASLFETAKKNGLYAD